MIITVSWTKGKTTITNTISELFKHIWWNKNILKVTNEEVIVFNNNEIIKKIDWKYIMSTWGKAPSVSPGRFFWYKYIYDNIDYFSLETSIGTLKYWLWIVWNIDVSILTNIYADHIDNKTIKNRNELIDKKLELVLDNVSKNNILFLNDEICINKFLDKYNNTIYKKDNIVFIIYKQDLNYLDKLKTIGDVFILDKNKLFLNSIDNLYYDLSEGFKLNFNWLLDTWTINLAIMIFLIFLLKKIGFITDEKKNIDYLKQIWFNEDYWRNILLKTKSGKKVILDFAHEEQSIKSIISFAKKISKWKVYFITRWRTDLYVYEKNLKKLWEVLWNIKVDYIWIYDKLSENKEANHWTFEKLWKEVLKYRNDVKLISNRFELFRYFFNKINENDILVYIINDWKDVENIKEIINWN